jgi:hypothetical protein
MLDRIHYNKFPFTGLQGTLTCSEKPSRNSYHESNTSYLNLPSHFINMDFCTIISKSVWAGIVRTVTRIYDVKSGVQILAGTKDLAFLQNFQTSFSTHTASNSMKTTAFSVEVKCTGQTV